MQDNLSSIAEQIRASSDGSAALTDSLGVHIVTLGCPKNEVDSHKMAERLADMGARLCDEPAKADCIIVNTCSFIQPATEESIEAVFDAISYKQNGGMSASGNSGAKVIVCGCMPSRYGEELTQSLPEADAFVTVDREADIVEVVDALFPGMLTGARVNAYSGTLSAYVKISDGCDRFCTFCTIPFIRGRYKSYPYQQVRDDVADAVALGAREVVLVAQDTGRWGRDFAEPHTLAWLLDTLAHEFPDVWLRVMYVQPDGVTDELLAAIAQNDNICSYLDIPFQHANADVLAAMGRKGDGQAFLELIDHARATVDGIALRTTLIAGFPGENEDQFEELIRFVEEAGIDYVGVFAYSAEDGTRAASLDGRVPDDVIAYRASRLRDVADASSSAIVSQRVGERMDVLVLGQEEDGQLFGRAKCQAPDVDGVVYLDRGSIGDVETVTIGDTLLYEMEAL